MKRKHVLVLSALMAMTIAAPQLSFAEGAETPSTTAEQNEPPLPPPPPGMPPHGDPERAEERALSKLNLTKEQKKKLREIRAQKRGEVEATRKEMGEKFKAFSEMFASDKSDAELRTAFEAIHALQAKLAIAHMESLLAARAILTPEQRKEFAEHMRSFQGNPGMLGRERRGKMRNHEMGMPRPTP